MGNLRDLDDIVNRCTGGSGGNPQNIFCYIDSRVGSVAANAGVAGRMINLWLYNQAPGGNGDIPTTVMNPTNETPGGIYHNDPAPGNDLWLLGMTASSSTPGTLILYDRLMQVGGFSGTDTSLNSITGGSTVRHTGTNSAGNLIYLEIYTIIGTTVAVATITYTNQDGVSGRQSSVSIGGGQLREPQRVISVPLQSGDIGVRSVESVQLDRSTGIAGSYGVVIGRPLLLTPLGLTGTGSVRDLIAGLPGIIRIEVDACLAYYWLSNAGLAPQIISSIHMVEA